MRERAISKILVGIDGSEYSFKASIHALEIAKNHNSKTIPLHILTEKISYEYEGNIDNPDTAYSVKKGLLQKYIEEAERWFDSIKQTHSNIDNLNFDTEILITKKSITDDIIEFAKVNSIDLIVMGTRGRSGLKKILLGSTALSVVTHTHCPVLVVR